MMRTLASRLCRAWAPTICSAGSHSSGQGMPNPREGRPWAWRFPFPAWDFRRSMDRLATTVRTETLRIEPQRWAQSPLQKQVYGKTCDDSTTEASERCLQSFFQDTFWSRVSSRLFHFGAHYELHVFAAAGQPRVAQGRVWNGAAVRMRGAGSDRDFFPVFEVAYMGLFISLRNRMFFLLMLKQIKTRLLEVGL